MQQDREDALQDCAASLRMADGILRDLVEAGAMDDDTNDLVELLRLTEERLEVLARLIEESLDEPFGSR